MKKIFLIIITSFVLFSFISCSEDSSSSKLSDSEIMIIASKAFSGAYQAQPALEELEAPAKVAAPAIPVYYTLSPDSGDWLSLEEGFNASIYFNNYTEPDYGIKFNGTIIMDFNLIDGLFSLTGSLDIVYEGESYNVTFNFKANTDADDLSGSITVDGTVYNL